jgi:hypothetical protein
LISHYKGSSINGVQINKAGLLLAPHGAEQYTVWAQCGVLNVKPGAWVVNPAL